MKDNIRQATFAEKWKSLGNVFVFNFSCFVAYLESMYGKKEVEKFLAFAANQAKFSYAPLKGKALGEVAAKIFHPAQSFFDIKKKEISPTRCMIETRCLMRSALREMSLRSDLLCNFCEQVIKNAVVDCVGCKMNIERTSDGCRMVLSTA